MNLEQVKTFVFTGSNFEKADEEVNAWLKENRYHAQCISISSCVNEGSLITQVLYKEYR